MFDTKKSRIKYWNYLLMSGINLLEAPVRRLVVEFQERDKYGQ